MVLLGISSCDCRKVEPEVVTYDHVAILYSVGRNDLEDNLDKNIRELANGNIPSAKDKDVMLIISQRFLIPSDTRGTFESSPYLIRLYKDKGKAVMDTLKAFPMHSNGGEINLLSDPAVMSETIATACNMFKSNSYGIIFSSHGSGWIPRGYYKNPVPPSSKALMSARKDSETDKVLPEGAVDYVPLKRDPSLPKTKSFGEQLFIEGLRQMSLESDVVEMVKALPVHFDYIVMDACLMGTVEVAYEFRNACDLLVVSPAEILDHGFDYEPMGDRLFGRAKPDVVGIAEDYFNYYNSKSGAERSATVTVVDCRQLEELASLCSKLFEKYSDKIAGVDPDRLGYYFSIPDRSWFYDLESLFIESGISQSDKTELEAVLDKVTPYRNSTKRILGFIDVGIYSGFSVYLPSMGDDYLDGYYRTLAWNKATGLVK